MGNCCIRDSSSATVWAGDDWGPIASEKPTEKEGLLGDDGKSSNAGGQVRIRISKKQLEELLRRVDGNGSSMRRLKADKILQKLIDKSDHFEIHHQRQWRPALQSIPEVN